MPLLREIFSCWKYTTVYFSHDSFLNIYCNFIDFIFAETKNWQFVDCEIAVPLLRKKKRCSPFSTNSTSSLFEPPVSSVSVSVCFYHGPCDFCVILCAYNSVVCEGVCVCNAYLFFCAVLFSWQCVFLTVPACVYQSVFIWLYF